MGHAHLEHATPTRWAAEGRAVKTAEVRKRSGTRSSGMFPMGEVLKLRKILDLIEFLASLK